MTDFLVDTSVLIKWFHSDGEGEVVEARALRDAHVSGRATAHIVDLALYEVGNVLVRALGWRAADVADQLDDLLTIVGPPLAMSSAWLRHGAGLAIEHGLSFYDAAWAAAAAGLGIPLVSADRRLVTARLAITPTEAATLLG